MSKFSAFYMKKSWMYLWTTVNPLSRRSPLSVREDNVIESMQFFIRDNDDSGQSVMLYKG